MKNYTRVSLTEPMIDDIWKYWNRLGDSSISKTAAFNRVADVVGCSHATVRRVVLACEEALSGKVIKYDGIKYTNHMMVDYVNKKFASSEKNTEKVEATSDIKLLAKSISELAAAVREQTRLIEPFISRR